MLNEDPTKKFQKDLEAFSMGAAVRQFVSDNITLCLVTLAVAGIAALANGAKGVLTHRRVGTVLLVIMVCRAYHAGATANRRPIIIKDIKDVETPNDPEQAS